VQNCQGLPDSSVIQKVTFLLRVCQGYCCRDPELAKGWGQIVTPLAIQTAGGKQKVNCSTAKGIFRIIQSIPSPKAEPFKLWIAQVAAERLDQMQDPELSIGQAMRDYKRLGYSTGSISG